MFQKITFLIVSSTLSPLFFFFFFYDFFFFFKVLEIKLLQVFSCSLFLTLGSTRLEPSCIFIRLLFCMSMMSWRCCIDCTESNTGWLTHCLL